MAGTIKEIRINGTGFSLPTDCSPKIIEGGREITGHQTFSDGTTGAIEGVVCGRVEGVKVNVNQSKFSQLTALKGKKNLPIVVDLPEKSCEFTGFIECESGFSFDAATEISDDFNLVCSTGKINISSVSA